MQSADFPRFKTLMTGMGRMFNASPDSTVLDVYWISLRDWTLADFEGAVGHLLQTAKFMPRPADFHDLRKAGNPTAGEAWTRARQAIRNANWSDIEATGFSCGDPLTNQAVHAIGGYRVIGMCESDKLHFLERRFAEHYEAMGDAQAVREAVPQIATNRPRQRLSGPQRAVLAIGVES